jgi:hypothetical protein
LATAQVHDFVTALIEAARYRSAGSVLDIPVTLNIKIDELAVKLQPGSIKLDVLR